MFLKLSPYTFTLFFSNKNCFGGGSSGKKSGEKKKTGFFKNVSKKYVKAIFSVLMDKVIYDKF